MQQKAGHQDQTSLSVVPPGGALRRIFAVVPAPVAVLCAEVDRTLVSFVASSFVPVSLDPPLVGVCIRHESASWPRLRGAERIGVSLLGAQQEHLARRLASRSPGKFDNVEVTMGPAREAFVAGAVLRMSCSLHAEIPAGDHDLALLGIHEADLDETGEPVVFHRSSFRRLSAPSAVDVLGWALEWQ